MRALVCSGFGKGENLALEERPLPEPGPGDIRVRVLACGANASDWEFVTGTPAYGRIARWFMRGDVLGSDVLGVVDKLGPGCTRFQIGDRVLADTLGTFGGFAEYCVAKEAQWVPVPEAVSDIDAVALPQSGTVALTGVQGRVGPGSKVLVNGAGGGSGPLAIQLAVEAGAEVWGVDTAAKAEVMRAAGAVRTLDFETEDFAEPRRPLRPGARPLRHPVDAAGAPGARPGGPVPGRRRARAPASRRGRRHGLEPFHLAARRRPDGAAGAGCTRRVARDGCGRAPDTGDRPGRPARRSPAGLDRHGRAQDRRQTGDRALIDHGVTLIASRCGHGDWRLSRWPESFPQSGRKTWFPVTILTSNG
ncbi:MAG: NAD(P)-dependent alcohol dehydrogenase [Paracoccaceae bacterium]